MLQNDTQTHLNEDIHSLHFPKNKIHLLQNGHLEQPYQEDNPDH